jgi:hypothetical protein
VSRNTHYKLHVQVVVCGVLLIYAIVLGKYGRITSRSTVVRKGIGTKMGERDLCVGRDVLCNKQSATS